MRRRILVQRIAASAVLPFAARAQQPALPVIGFLHAGLPEPNAKFVVAFREGLSATGFIEGQNVTVEYRWAAGLLNSLPFSVIVVSALCADVGFIESSSSMSDSMMISLLRYNPDSCLNPWQ
jgi:hypothetical protein